MDTLTQPSRELGGAAAGTLGPLGTSALVVQQDGSVETTATVTELVELVRSDDPTLTVVERALDQHEATTGDGTCSLLVLAGRLLAEGAELAGDGLHPSSIAQGYAEAVETAVDRLAGASVPLSTAGRGRVVATALTSLRDPSMREQLATRLRDAAETMAGDSSFDPRDVTVVSRLGDPLSETELVRGAVLDQGPVLETMPRRVEGGIALLTTTVDVETLGGETNARGDTGITLRSGSFDQRAAVREWERESFEQAVADAAAAGCRVVITSRAVNDRVKTTLDRAGILAVQRVDEAALGRIARATGARPVPQLDAVGPETVGDGTVRVERKAGDDMVVIRSEAEKPVYTLFCRAPDERSLAAFERDVESALASLLAVTTTDDAVVPGGGAAEADAARAVRDYVTSVDDRRALAVEAFADALMALPGQLAANAGMDRVDAVSKLRAAHAAGDRQVGVDATARSVRNVVDREPIVDAERVRRRVWTAATELAVQLLRVDDVVQVGAGATAGGA
jgi:chaperonin GroEL (HSP60 family)